MDKKTEREQRFTNVLDIFQGREHELYSNQDITDESQMMFPAYRFALNALKGILDSTKAWNVTREDNGKRRETALYGYANNILAFCAARGQGKTSAMLSFSRALEKYEDSNRDSQLLKDSLGGWHFHVMQPIDPTMLRNGETVLELVLARLLNEINIKWRSGADEGRNSRSEDATEHGKIQVLDRFNVCLEGVRQEKNADDDRFGGDRLLRANDIFDIKDNLREIVLYYLNLLGWDRNSGILIIQLDDTDMQFEGAYYILEEVRKYLSIPNVVVLMATYLKQLRDLVELQYKRTLVPNCGEFDVFHMAAKYIDKLIPASQTIHLPSIKMCWEASERPSVRLNNGVEKVGVEDLEKKLFDLVYEKTGLAFIRHEKYIHDLIPSTLRGVAHLFRLLLRMETPEPLDKLHAQLENTPESMRQYVDARLRSTYTRQANLLLFEDYFMNDWMVSRVEDPFRSNLREVGKNSSNRRMLQAIKELKRFYFAEDREEGEKVPKVANAAQFVDLLEWVSIIESDVDKCTTDEDFRFLFSLLTFFSIQLHKAALADEIRSIEEWKNPSTKGNEKVDNAFGDKPLYFHYRTLYSMLKGDMQSAAGVNGNEPKTYEEALASLRDFYIPQIGANPLSDTATKEMLTEPIEGATDETGGEEEIKSGQPKDQPGAHGSEDEEQKKNKIVLFPRGSYKNKCDFLLKVIETFRVKPDFEEKLNWPEPKKLFIKDEIADGGSQQKQDALDGKDAHITKFFEERYYAYLDIVDKLLCLCCNGDVLHQLFDNLWEVDVSNLPEKKKANKNPYLGHIFDKLDDILEDKDVKIKFDFKAKYNEVIG